MTGRLQQWLLGTTDERIYGRVRIGFAAVALLNLVALWPDRMALFSDRGLIDPDALATMMDGPELSLFFHLGSPAGVNLICTLGAAALVLLGLGVVPRAAAVAVFVWQLSYTTRAPHGMAGWDHVLTCFAFLLVFSPLGTAWSVRPRTALMVPCYGLSLMRMQVVVIYWQTVLGRFGAPHWFDGEFLSYYLLCHHSRFAGPWVIEWGWLLAWFTWGTMLIELVLPVLLFLPRTRWLGLVLGVLLHVGIAAVSVNLWVFSLTMIMTYLAFLRGEDFKLPRRWFAGRAGREQEQIQPAD